jgi:hypothetical protein
MYIETCFLFSSVATSTPFFSQKHQGTWTLSHFNIHKQLPWWFFLAVSIVFRQKFWQCLEKIRFSGSPVLPGICKIQPSGTPWKTFFSFKVFYLPVMLVFSAIYNNTGIHRHLDNPYRKKIYHYCIYVGVSFLKLKWHQSFRGLFPIFSAFYMRKFSAFKSL